MSIERPTAKEHTPELSTITNIAVFSGERTRPRVPLRGLAAMFWTGKSSRWRGRHRQHARRVRSPDSLATPNILSTRSDRGTYSRLQRTYIGTARSNASPNRRSPSSAVTARVTVTAVTDFLASRLLIINSVDFKRQFRAACGYAELGMATESIAEVNAIEDEFQHRPEGF